MEEINGENVRALHTAQAIEETAASIAKLGVRIEKQQSGLQTFDGDTVNKDWAQNYRRWDKWDDVEELQNIKADEESKLQSLMRKNVESSLGHYHDHTEERAFYELSENDKFLRCEQYRKIGNYLFSEGQYETAAEHYRVAIAYYEYCFPEESNDEEVSRTSSSEPIKRVTQKDLDHLRHACLCNSSLCLIRLKRYRLAVEAASKVINEQSSLLMVKALYRRAKAYTLLDEYDSSLMDLQSALKILPSDVLILKEISHVKQRMERYHSKAKIMSCTMLNTCSTTMPIPPPLDNESINNHFLPSSMPALFSIHLPVEPILPQGLLDWVKH
mmetsp:Transcript_30550/g.43821  ORF Transcript_30550/g.43821 Transcript_30550/m.43821 type:complete len:329 (-) Transcript_30550:149-1135(-)|eukprot:CAMPEP_0170059736 /NCGR_PEP_ID=MMETSP0019_2-20121128/1915_1 /TAXON_ID=98059 /ORGANISM="Dinobryon sp., Strain UTEXLB2267" /LENGTH=328 /DNA_ID=CAMNT_0010265087 /DNA_START=14 /DNA_END=1000 /DNA_ORIENTATION=-